jgi:hypothetical protein
MPAPSANETHWDYWTCPLRAPAASFGGWEGVVELWSGRIPTGQRLPPRSSFDILDLRGWWGQVAIARIEHNPLDVRFTLWGTRLTDWWGVDYTNKRIGEISKNPEAWLETEGRYFAAMANEPFIGIAAGPLDQHGRSYKKVMSIDLPMGTEDALTHVLAVHMEIDLEASPMDMLPGCRMTRFRTPG